MDQSAATKITTWQVGYFNFDVQIDSEKLSERSMVNAQSVSRETAKMKIAFSQIGVFRRKFRTQPFVNERLHG